MTSHPPASPAGALLPCPFCGDEAAIVFTNTGSVGCINHSCPANDIACSPNDWNRRAADVLDMLDMNRLHSGDYRALNPNNQPIFDKIRGADNHTPAPDLAAVRRGIYVASRTTRAGMWRELRASGVPITSSWIDEAGEGETADFSELWTRIHDEIRSSVGLLFYANVEDAPWKGAFVEIGMALAMGKPVAVVVVGDLEGRTMRPVGSWMAHPLVTGYETVQAAASAILAALKAKGG